MEAVTIVLATSGAYTNGNVLLQGEPVCWDMTSLCVNNLTTPTTEAVTVPVNTTSAGNVAGVYQGNTITNASTTAVLTTQITMRRLGYGVVLAGGVTTSVKVGSKISILPGSTPTYASQLVGSDALTAGGTVYYVGMVVATGAITTSGGIVISASTTTQGLVNAYIATLDS
jgi:hypothetical protein